MKKRGTKAKTVKHLTGVCPECGKRNCMCVGIAKAKKAKRK